MNIIVLTLKPSNPALVQSIVDAFLWRTHDRRKLRVDEMKLDHVFNSFRMLWQSRVPEAMWLPGVKVWDTSRMKKPYITAALLALARRLERDQHLLKDWQLMQLDAMFAFITADVLPRLEESGTHHEEQA